jgi:hypothetical protein
MTTSATSGFGVQLKRGDGGVGAGTQASKTIGTVNQQLKVLAKLAGTAGNSKTFGITVSGTASFSISVTSTAVAIISASTSGTATTTVAEAISALYLDPTFVAHFQATVGTGNGSGVLVNGASGVLSGGAEGTEAFTTIAEVKSIGGPNMSAQVIDVTNMDSADNTREYITNLIDPGDLTFAINFLPTNTSQQGLYTDLKNRTRRNFRLVWTDEDATTCSLQGIVTGFQISQDIESALAANVSIKITGAPSWF